MIRRRNMFFMVMAASMACTGTSAACTVSATPMAFGVVDPLAGVPTDSAGYVSVACIDATSYEIAIGGGNGPVNDRRMAGSSAGLDYQLYTDAGRSHIWGDGTAGTVTVAGSAGPTQAEHIVYARIPSQPYAKAGQYSDVVIVTVSF